MDCRAIVDALTDADVTHVVWLPDSDMGALEGLLDGHDTMRLVRVCREGEAMATAAGLTIGGARPAVVIQSTGFFEAGDALRNVVHDCGLSLLLLIGYRGYAQHADPDERADSAGRLLEPTLTAWRIPYEILEQGHEATAIPRASRTVQAGEGTRAILLPE
jgi:sulfopyruvate decarboxylase TPP-binding subunit